MNVQMLKGVAASLLILLAAVSCRNMRDIQYRDTPLAAPVRGTVAMIGCQLYNPAVSWTIGNTTYTVPFIFADVLYAGVTNELPAMWLSNRIAGKVPGDILRKYRNELDKASIGTHAVANAGAFEVLECVDENGFSSIDPICLKYLNANIGKDNYLFFQGSIKSFVAPHLFNGFRFMLEPRITAVIFDRNGRKIFSRSYSRMYDSIKDDHQLVRTYYQYLLKCLEDSSQDIRRDLGFMSVPDEAGGSVVSQLSGRGREPSVKRSGDDFWK